MEKFYRSYIILKKIKSAPQRDHSGYCSPLFVCLLPLFALYSKYTSVRKGRANGQLTPILTYLLQVPQYQHIMWVPVLERKVALYQIG